MDAIVLDKISKSFHGKEVLKNFSAVFPMGETTCIMAPSGAGKTTLLRILCAGQNRWLELANFCF